jgi:hypothetical protein
MQIVVGANYLNVIMTMPVGSLSGKVSDASGNGISGIQIYPDWLSSYITTDSSGNYSLPNIPPGSHTIQYLAQGYITVIKTVNIAAGNNSLNVTIVPFRFQVGATINYNDYHYYIWNVSTINGQVEYLLGIYGDANQSNWNWYPASQVDASATSWTPPATVAVKAVYIAQSPVQRSMLGYLSFVLTLLAGHSYNWMVRANKKNSDPYNFNVKSNWTVYNIPTISGQQGVPGDFSIATYVSMVDAETGMYGLSPGTDYQYELLLIDNTQGGAAVLGIFTSWYPLGDLTITI